MSELVIRTGKHQGKKLVISDEGIIIGRDETCRIRLASMDVSRRHCLIKKTPDGLVACDLGSGNGTFVNDFPIQDETLLQPGDLLRVGPLELQLPGKKKGPKKSDLESSIFSEDDIAHWLSDEDDEGGEAGAISQSDTTIIKAEQLLPSAPAGNAPKQFKTISEEAADIIRRHWESVSPEEEEEV